MSVSQFIDKNPSLSSWTCARRFLHAEITRISVWVGENPGVFPCRATWSFHEVCTSILYCSITKKGELAIHHQCNSCIMNCCSLRLFKVGNSTRVYGNPMLDLAGDCLGMPRGWGGCHGKEGMSLTLRLFLAKRAGCGIPALSMVAVHPRIQQNCGHFLYHLSLWQSDMASWKISYL